MTIEQIEELLPNGLHDAEIRECVMNFEHARLRPGVKVRVGLPTERHPANERYRP